MKYSKVTSLDAWAFQSVQLHIVPLTASSRVAIR